MQHWFKTCFIHFNVPCWRLFLTEKKTFVCRLAHHPDFPGYTTEGEVPSEPICNVPRHPPIPIVEIHVPSPTPSPVAARSPSPPVRDPGPVICNIPFHPQYPALMGDSSPLSLPVCSVPGHPPLLCNASHLIRRCLRHRYAVHLQRAVGLNFEI